MTNGLSETAKVTRVSNAVAAGTTAINSSSVDTKGFAAVEFLVAMGTIVSGAATSLKLQGSDDDSNWDDLEGTSQTIADDDDNTVFIADVLLPQHRYVRCVVSRATQNATVDGIIALSYRAAAEPVTHGATVGGSELHASPIVGTA
jgi:hypothetical protein